MTGVQVPSLDYPKTIKDPVHGYIPLTKLEYEILQHPVFNRLHDLKQTSMAYLVFPGAITTRFLHSVGAMHIASRIIQQLLHSLDPKKFEELFPKATQDSVKLSIIQMVRLAALLHDIGHGPFSHATEKIMLGVMQEDYKGESDAAAKLFGTNAGAPFPAHEYYSYKLVTETDLSTIIESESKQSQDPKLEQISADSVASLIIKTGKSPVEYVSEVGLGILRKIISSQLDADRMDYLVRDGYMTGVSYGLVDLDRVIMNMSIRQDVNRRYELVVHERAIGAIEDILDARFKMYKWVYSHHLVASLNEMLTQALAALVDDKKMAAADFHWKSFVDRLIGDTYLVSQIRATDPSSNELLSGLTDRRYSPISVLKRPNDHRAFQVEIAKATGRESPSTVIQAKLDKFFEDTSSSPRVKLSGAEVRTIATRAPRSPYSPLKKGDSIWICSDRDATLDELTSASKYFDFVNTEWTEFPNYYISYIEPGKKRQQAISLREEYRRELVKQIAGY